MSGIRLIIKEAEATEQGILITKASIIDSETGIELRIAKLTPELANFFTCIEIDIERYQQIIDMCNSNEAFKHLVIHFNLIS